MNCCTYKIVAIMHVLTLKFPVTEKYVKTIIIIRSIIEIKTPTPITSLLHIQNITAERTSYTSRHKRLVNNAIRTETNSNHRNGEAMKISASPLQTISLGRSVVPTGILLHILRYCRLLAHHAADYPLEVQQREPVVGSAGMAAHTSWVSRRMACMDSSI